MIRTWHGIHIALALYHGDPGSNLGYVLLQCSQAPCKSQYKWKLCCTTGLSPLSTLHQHSQLTVFAMALSILLPVLSNLRNYAQSHWGLTTSILRSNPHLHFVAAPTQYIRRSSEGFCQHDMLSDSECHYATCPRGRTWWNSGRLHKRLDRKSFWKLEWPKMPAA